MKVEVEEVSPVIRRLNIEIPAEQVDDEIEEQYKEVQSKAQVPGFRPGKVPRKILERRFWKQIHELAMEELVKHSLEPAMSRKDIQPLVEPVIDPSEVVPGEPYKYSVHIEVKPQIDPDNYKGVTVTHKDEEVSDEDVERSIASVQESVSTIKEIEEDRPVKDGDEVALKITGKDKDGQVLIDEEKDEVKINDDSVSWIPNLAERLKGRSKGEVLEFTETLPDDADVFENIAGKTLDFKIEIETIKETILPELNDDFAKEYTQHETMDDLRESIKERLMERTTKINMDRMQGAVLDKIVENNDVEVPPTLVKEEAKRQAREFFKTNLGREVGEDELEGVLEMFKSQAEKSFKINFLLDAIAEKEGIEATDEDVERKIAERAEMSGMHPDKLKDRLDDNAKDSLKQQVRLENTLDFLVREANISDKEEEPDAKPEQKEESDTEKEEQ